ncbi:HlyD family secretion protein [Chitinophaga sp. Cy-1792]|uniref:HlyD family secretion protein n=1 Tax=Chitinophaga sp. Cy-1792 TaxID=2608339 RepID=UPI001420FB4B|nr:HlyD family efflux transporter periplasmic adaptor subunit [Chitinophaga sp. Cy-1792]NIG56020.1 HlyD family efflux transporter periplasmic adaptor subunit [Chitinophaga sp. Cy-1792]
MKQLIVFTIALISMTACGDKKQSQDASGNFEADEVIVSAQQNGELLSFNVVEGTVLRAGDSVGQIDVKIPSLQKAQVEASIAALQQKTSSPAEKNELVRKQLAVQESQLEQLIREQKRTENLVKEDAATRKQLDDLNSQVDQMHKQIAATRQQMNLDDYTTGVQNKTVLSEKAPLEMSAAQYAEQIRKGKIINPITGMVLTRYALQGELATIGKPLYKIANTDTLYLRAYVDGTQLPQIKTGQQVTVRIDQGRKSYKNYTGTISWISDKSEFTPKTIQTKNERANLVYAIKVRVKNDGFLKIGMYGEALWSQQ